MEPLFSVDCIYTFEAYKKFNRTIYTKIAKYPIKFCIYIALLLALALFSMFVLRNGMPIAIGIFVGTAVILVMIPMLRKRSIKKAWDSNKLIRNAEYTINFYDTWFEQISENGTSKVEYSKLYTVIGDDSAFYLMISKNQGIMVSRQNCSEELAAFIESLDSYRK